ncbi:enhanced serine sensitivity protein SseB C-terminal domain-containing protein [uncultured Cocleimonas sp.]|uniref:enhanced serine sensitivity protein SseB C-terminal domain-containing protein n=1 Tax=uncultured Cocleimonas sp. TaxID=1051587 RepID=UPI00261516D3|nr:enhanced serine sensitivity protein SseB C-terminal domain-containing protein [uncultured Cocleimonas sp.]
MLLPTNDLEKALHKAAADHNEAPAFYEALMESKIFVLGKPEEEDTGNFTLEEEQAVIIQHWERETDQSPVVPFFTSLQMLQQAIDTDEPYLELTTVDLFQLTMGAPLVLNPNSEFGMEFDPEDIAVLLDTDLMQNNELTLDEHTEVLLGVPENVSDSFTGVLTEYFSRQKEVEAAYLGTIQIPDDDDKEHLMVGIQGKGKFDKIIDTAIQKISLLEDDMMYETVDFYVVDQDDPDISQFMVENIVPFYTAEARVMH